MSVIARRLTVTELSQQILEMAKTGVYRESVFEALHPLATKKQIRAAIAHAKQFGLHSVASLRDETLGTYYEVDLVKYQSLQHAIHRLAPLSDAEDSTRRLVNATQTIQMMLSIAGGLTVGLGAIAAVCLVLGMPRLSLDLFAGAISAAGIWVLQKGLARQNL